MFNSALESMAKVITGESHPHLGNSLDIGSAAVLLASIGAYTVFHFLMRRGQATGVTSLLYLTPPVAVICEWLIFGTLPGWLSVLGMAVACAGVAMVSRRQGP